MFCDNSPFMAKFCRESGRSNFTAENWHRENGARVRKLSYNVARSALVASHRVFERQQIRAGRQGVCTVETIALTPDVPCGTTFVTRVRYVISPTELPAEGTERKFGTRIQMSFCIEWVRSPPMIRGAIVSGAHSGMQHIFGGASSPATSTELNNKNKSER